MSKYGYVRVSTTQQNIGRQLRTMMKEGVDIGNLDPLTADNNIFNSIRSGDTFIDKLSGKDTNRPMFQELLNTVQSGDTIVFDEISRMGRSLRDILNTTEKLISNNVNIRFVKENVDPTTTLGKALLAMLGTVAQIERDLILERTKEGVSLAKEKGKYHGRQPLNIEKKQLDMIMTEYIKHRLSIREACRLVSYTKANGERQIGVSVPTFYKLKDQWLSDNNIEKVEYVQKEKVNETPVNNKNQFDDTNIPDDIFDDLDFDNSEPIDDMVVYDDSYIQE